MLDWSVSRKWNLYQDKLRHCIFLRQMREIRKYVPLGIFLCRSSTCTFGTDISFCERLSDLEVKIFVQIQQGIGHNGTAFLSCAPLCEP